jgi:hypothetical protein
MMNIIEFLAMVFFLNGLASGQEEPSPFLPGGGIPIETTKDSGRAYFLGGHGENEPLKALSGDEQDILYFLPGGAQKEKVITTPLRGRTYFLPKDGEATPPDFMVTEKDEILQDSAAYGFSKEALSRPMESDTYQKMEKSQKFGKSTLDLLIYLNNFDYKDPTGAYQATFEGGNGGFINNFFFLGSYNLFIYKGFFNFAAGMDLGISYMTGKGVFVTGQTSDVTMVLWSVPVDITLNLEFPIFEVFHLVAYGGPSAMTLIQNRNDFSPGETGRNFYQISPGYFFGGRAKINLGKIFKDVGRSLFNSTSVTFFSFNLDARYENYSKFADPHIGVSGLSFGIGFSYEFL